MTHAPPEPELCDGLAPFPPGAALNAIGASTYLWIGAVWVVVSAIAVGLVPSVRNLQTDPAPVAPAAAPG
jgi:hypothetical protein